jgi:DNA-binding beta-propeller fold protein YncE
MGLPIIGRKSLPAMKMFRLGLAAILSTVGLGAANAATMVLGGYPDQLMFVDEANGKVLERISLATGLPTGLVMSNDKKKIYVTTITTSGIEVLDTATRKIVTSFSLNTPTIRYRFNGGVPDPTGRYFYVVGTRMDREIDRYKISKPQYMVIDLQEKKVVRAVDLAAEDDGPSYRSRLAISPDGKSLYLFRDKIIIVDTKDLKAVDRIDLAKPNFPGTEDVSMGGALENLRTPNEFVSLFDAQDPYIHNKVFGIARLDLSSRQFTFTPIGPSPTSMAGLQVTPDGKDGYTVAVIGDLGSQRCEFWHFDIATTKALDKAEFPCRRRFYFGMSADGKKLYVYGAGFDVAVYDAKTLKPVKDWELQNDATMAGMLFVQ